MIFPTSWESFSANLDLLVDAGWGSSWSEDRYEVSEDLRWKSLGVAEWWRGRWRFSEGGSA